MNNKYYLVGAYETAPVYFSRKYGLKIGSRMDELQEPSSLEKEAIIKCLGGMKTIDRLVRNYEKNEVREAKKNGIK